MVKAIHDLVQHHAKISPTKLGHLELRLLADEAGGLLHEPSITTVTFYRGAVSQRSSTFRSPSCVWSVAAIFS